MTKFEGDQGSHVPQIILYNCIVILVFHPQSQLLSVRSGMAARRSRGLWWVKFIITSDFSLLFLVQMFNLIKSSSNAGLPRVPTTSVVTLNIKTSRCTDHLVPDALHRGRARVRDRHHVPRRVHGGPRRAVLHHPGGILGGAPVPEGEDLQ